MTADPAYHRHVRIAVRAAGAAALMLMAFMLVGCGSDDSSSLAQDPAPSSPSATVSKQTHPSCVTVWRDGHTLPQSYRGCTSDAGTYVKAEVYDCSDGHRLVTYAHSFYASPGRTISRATTTLAKDHDFQHTMAVCGA